MFVWDNTISSSSWTSLRRTDQFTCGVYIIIKKKKEKKHYHGKNRDTLWVSGDSYYFQGESDGDVGRVSNARPQIIQIFKNLYRYSSFYKSCILG